MKVLFTQEDYHKAKAKDLLPCECYFCHNVFHAKKVLITRERSKPRNRIRFCNQRCLHGYMSIGKTFQTNCTSCNKSLTKRHKEKTRTGLYFCNHSCCARYYNIKRIRTPEYRLNISQSIKNYNQKNPHKESGHNRKRSCVCEVCCKEFIKIGKGKKPKACSIVCRKILHINSGKRSAQSRQKRSNDEIFLYEMCKSHFEKVENNKIILDGWDSDICINNKYLIFWNGPWHYKEMKIHGVSLKQIQHRDYMKSQLFMDNGYVVIIYEDKSFTPIEAFEDLKNFIT